ncbi:alpha-ketoglutarate-dependent dioxygenase alkB homolog 3-like [Limulus polyphemus]|uniref:Alpha-ketoglutarate-dependent dioxygenase alkB homolog 3-like n=1 Tax=Limulus polyphemus TaxID=6850 RepID=A0ABM1T123_LIMPO|nr:alpha-ketoglutarate-dependent dioxygenase alkB homolog 3-like [Limulus polyphemus]XP_022249577.1 alpha-ketoglutarate-dependent dioxygenase alkB homolog 3-like [Limulus polyphemus]XP_022249578.1 alpha-ketoglutarate-dependent dioxygenase alkB homolog 3-like [Limulus polyphemus]XP_022249579.1 alpha-ketoglutarate-dependent dioxygenase alkB homolog 3-like [Limulus polyphemus]
MSDKRRNARIQGSWAGRSSQKCEKGLTSGYTGKSMFEYKEGESSVGDDPFQKEETIEIKDPGEHSLVGGTSGSSSVYFQPDFFTPEEADRYFDKLIEQRRIPWKQTDIKIMGEKYPTPRLVAWYGPFPYSYSGVTLEADQKWPDDLKEIQLKVEQHLNEIQKEKVSFNSVLLNLYRNGKDSVAWHSDDELSMGVHPVIASVSLGETRKFELKKRPPKYNSKARTKSSVNENIDYRVHLKNGSLIVMKGVLQQDWLHRVPKEYHDRGRRINLTFRTVYEHV